MWKVDPNTYTITGTRGDSGLLSFTLQFDGVPYELQSGDVARFAVNTGDHEASPLIEKELDNYVLTLNPSDTKDLDFGTYYYDIQITFAESGYVPTYLEKKKFKLTWEAD